MAFNISITKKGRINWTELHNYCKSIDRNFVTIYPIQQNSILKVSGIGISINLKKDYELFWEDFSVLLSILIKQGFQVVELYSGSIINIDGVEKLKKLITG